MFSSAGKVQFPAVQGKDVKLVIDLTQLSALTLNKDTPSTTLPPTYRWSYVHGTESPRTANNVTNHVYPSQGRQSKPNLPTSPAKVQPKPETGAPLSQQQQVALAAVKDNMQSRKCRRILEHFGDSSMSVEYVQTALQASRGYVDYALRYITDLRSVVGAENREKIQLVKRYVNNHNVTVEEVSKALRAVRGSTAEAANRIIERRKSARAAGEA